MAHITSREVVLSVAGAAALLSASTFGIRPGFAQVTGSLPAFVKLQSSTPGTAQTGHSNITGTMIAGQHVGGGAGLTGLNGTSIATGTVADARLSSNIARLGTSQTFTGANSFTGGFSTDAFVMNVGATDGEILKTDANGVGTWQRDGFTMPLSGSVASFATGISLSHTGTGDLASFNINNAASTAEAVQGTSNGTGDVFQATMTGTGRAGYFAINNTGQASDNYALEAYTNGHNGAAAVYGLSEPFDSSTTMGVFGETSSSSGRGVYGLNNNTTGTNIQFGVLGTVVSNQGTGVGGHALNANGNGKGVAGSVDSGGNGYGVYSYGDFGSSGTKAFRIDHPHDPMNKYLLHYSAESPMPQNFYTGNVVTDGNGYAWVTLPDYFQDINTNFKYQLTVVDDANSNGFVMAKVSNKIRGNRFQVRTSAPNIEVSWRVDADRNDAHVRFKRPVDVLEKPDYERGTYQDPVIYGLPAKHEELQGRRPGRP